MMERVFQRPASLKDMATRYCPGCGHSLVHRLLAEVIDDLDLARRAVGVPPGGCAQQAPAYLDLDMGEAPHGQGLAVATGIKRALPGALVFAYQDDGDLAAGTGAAVHAAERGENLTVILVNNGVHRLGGGLAALAAADDPAAAGPPPISGDGPLDLAAMLALSGGSVYLERVSVSSPENQARAKRALARAFRAQMDGLGFSLVEVLAPCPAGWGQSPVEALSFVDHTLAEAFPPGVLKDLTGYPEAGEQGP